MIEDDKSTDKDAILIALEARNKANDVDKRMDRHEIACAAGTLLTNKLLGWIFKLLWGGALASLGAAFYIIQFILSNNLTILVE